MTITHSTETATVVVNPQHESILDLVAEASCLPARPGLTDVLALIRTAIEHDALNPELAHRLGMQVRVLAGSAPVDDDLETELLMQALLFELAEVAAEVDGVHVDELGPRIDALLSAGDERAALRLLLLSDVAHSRQRTLLSSLSADLDAA